MSIATKTLATIMMVAMLSLSNVSMTEARSHDKQNYASDEKNTKQLERLYRKHDKKMEIRASVLGMTPEQLKTEVKQKPFSQIMKKAGFKTDQAFHVAIIGKLKYELHARGWDENHINNFVQKKFSKLYQR